MIGRGTTSPPPSHQKFQIFLKKFIVIFLEENCIFFSISLRKCAKFPASYEKVEDMTSVRPPPPLSVNVEVDFFATPQGVIANQ